MVLFSVMATTFASDLSLPVAKNNVADDYGKFGLFGNGDNLFGNKANYAPGFGNYFPGNGYQKGDYYPGGYDGFGYNNGYGKGYNGYYPGLGYPGYGQKDGTYI